MWQACSDHRGTAARAPSGEPAAENRSFTAWSAALWIPHCVCTELMPPLGLRQPTRKHSRETHSGPLLEVKRLVWWETGSNTCHSSGPNVLSPALQPSPLSVSKTRSSPETETLWPWSIFPRPLPSSLASALALCVSDSCLITYLHA